MSDEVYDDDMIATPSSSNNSVMNQVIDTIVSMKNDFKIEDVKSMVDKLPSEISDPVKKVLEGDISKDKFIEIATDACSKMGFDINSLMAKYSSDKSSERTNALPVKRDQKEGDVYTLRINSSRKVKIGVAPVKTIRKSVSILLGVPENDLMESAWSSLSVGPWKDNEFTLWHNTKARGPKNRRTSKVLGYASSSEIVITCDKKLTEAEFIEVEKLL